MNRHYSPPAVWDKSLNLVAISPIDLEIIKLYAKQEGIVFNCTSPKVINEYFNLCHKQAAIEGIKCIKRLLKTAKTNKLNKDKSK